jgi:hypothetical protein
MHCAKKSGLFRLSCSTPPQPARRRPELRGRSAGAGALLAEHYATARALDKLETGLPENLALVQLGAPNTLRAAPLV